MYKSILFFSLFISLISCGTSDPVTTDNSTSIEISDTTKTVTTTDSADVKKDDDTKDTTVQKETTNTDTPKDSLVTTEPIDSTIITTPIDTTVLDTATIDTAIIDTTTIDTSITIDTTSIDTTFAVPELVSANFTFTTKTYNGDYGPAHTQAIWIEDMAGNFVSTIGRWAQDRMSTLEWTFASGFDDVKTGATETSHGNVTVNNWEPIDKNGNKINEGEYILKIEFNETELWDYHQISQSKITISNNIEFLDKDETDYIYNLDIISNTKYH